MASSGCGEPLARCGSSATGRGLEFLRGLAANAYRMSHSCRKKPCDAVRSHGLRRRGRGACAGCHRCRRLRKGRADMGQIEQFLRQAATGGPFLQGEGAALADPEDAAHPADRKAGRLRIDEGECHRFPALAKKVAAVPEMSRSRFRTACSRRSRFNSAGTSIGVSLGFPSLRSWLSRRGNVDRRMPRSCAISRRVRPLVSASLTA